MTAVIVHPQDLINFDVRTLYALAEERASIICKCACACLPVLGPIRLTYNLVGCAACTLFTCGDSDSMPDEWCRDACLKPAEKVNCLAEVYFCAFCDRGYNARANPERFLNGPEREVMFAAIKAKEPVLGPLPEDLSPSPTPPPTEGEIVEGAPEACQGHRGSVSSLISIPEEPENLGEDP